MKSGKLNPLKSKAGNKFDVYGFDVETEHIRKDFMRGNGKSVKAWEQRFLMGSIIGKNHKKVFWNRKEMASEMLSRKYRGSMMMATNLEFDFNILFHDRIPYFKYIYRNGLIGAIHERKENDRVRRWEFTDSMNYIKASLEKLGSIVNLPKLSRPSTFVDNEDGLGCISVKPKTYKERLELESYNIRDSEITYKFAEMFKSFCDTHNMRMKLTIGSVGMDYWRRNHQENTMIREPDTMIYKHFDGAFRGGATQTIKRGFYDQRLWYYDYRSSYPAMMVKGTDGKGSYPDPSSHVYRSNPTTELVERYDGICRADIKAPYMRLPILAVKISIMQGSKKLLFPYGNFEGWFTNAELRTAMDFGYEVNPKEMIYYEKSFTPFKEAVKYLYRLRKKYKMQKHPFEAMVKTLMNSGLFGKWGTNFTNMDELIPLTEVEFMADGRCFYNGEEITNFNIHDYQSTFDGFISKKKEGTPMRYSFPILSSYTTALGRERLMLDANKHEKKVCYMDTDSIVATNPCYVEGGDLGDWELEHKLKAGIFVKPKFYMLVKDDDDVICKSKGVGKFIKDRREFMTVLNTKSVSMERFAKMREANSIGIKAGTLFGLTKKFNLEDDKRNWLGNRFNIDRWQDSEPLYIGHRTD